MERAAYTEGHDPLRAARASEIERHSHRHSLAAYDDLLGGVDVGDVCARLPRYLLDSHLVQAKHRCHGARVALAGLLHQQAPRPHQLGGFGHVEHACHGQGGVLAQAVTRHQQRLGHELLAELLFHRPHAGQAYGHDGRLGVDRLAKLVLGAVEHKLRERPLQRIVHLPENLTRGGRAVEQLAAHADCLRALARKQKPNLGRVGVCLESQCHVCLLRCSDGTELGRGPPGPGD